MIVLLSLLFLELMVGLVFFMRLDGRAGQYGYCLSLLPGKATAATVRTAAAGASWQVRIVRAVR
ncbi:hypothetical protein CSC74_09580 [Pseudoxanthomonas yeongjuensis]|nr:hypothetical protein CSC74_09580 [Pseudoxanthomonas yeongjuensis]